MLKKKSKKNETIFCLCSNFSPFFSTLSKLYKYAHVSKKKP